MEMSTHGMSQASEGEQALVQCHTESTNGGTVVTGAADHGPSPLCVSMALDYLSFQREITQNGYVWLKTLT
jgi:uncharacterized protein (DUF2237 family)